MKYFIILFFTVLILGVSITAQSQNANELEMRSNFFGSKFYKGDTIMGINQVLEEMAPNEAVYNLMISAKKDNVFAQLLGAAGGFMIGWPVGTAIGGGEPNWTMAGIGAGLVAISIPISSNFKKKALSAIKQHNNLLTASNNRHLKPIYSVSFGGTSCKLKVRF